MDTLALHRRLWLEAGRVNKNENDSKYTTFEQRQAGDRDAFGKRPVKESSEVVESGRITTRASDAPEM